jgi:hypothetical protein
MNNKGQTLVIFIVFLPILILLVATMVDISLMYSESQSIDSVTVAILVFYMLIFIVSVLITILHAIYITREEPGIFTFILELLMCLFAIILFIISPIAAAVVMADVYIYMIFTIIYLSIYKHKNGKIWATNSVVDSEDNYLNENTNVVVSSINKPEQPTKAEPLQIARKKRKGNIDLWDFLVWGSVCLAVISVVGLFIFIIKQMGII